MKKGDSRIFGSNFSSRFRFGVKISNFQLLGCVKAEKLSFLEGWLIVCGYWWIPGPIFERRTIFKNDISSQFQICSRNFKFPTFGVHKSWNTLLFRRLIFWLWLLMDMTAFPGPIFKSRTIFGNDFSSWFQICGPNFKFLIFGTHKSKLFFLEG